MAAEYIYATRKTLEAAEAYVDALINADIISECEYRSSTIRKEGNKLWMEAVFRVKLEDYGIEIPTLLFQNIAEEVEVTVKFEFNR